ncbi:hypothetical protein [Phenylobacterium sp.]|uniref:hypothetical protein n=1 Tax=Phenylobacterium sp. TaxID=1871053 RepID=UPI0030F46FBC
MKTVVLSVLAAAILASGAPALAQDIANTEKLSLKPKRVKGLLLGYGYDLGEYSGQVKQMNKQTRALGMFSSDYAKTTFTIGSPRLKAPMAVSCEGGQNRFGMGWIDFKRNDLAYVCNFDGGPSDASFALVLSDGKFMDKLYQPQRAAEIRYGGVTLRAKTKKLPGSMPLGGGGTPSYVILKGDQEVGGMVRTPMKGAFYLPVQGSPDRDAAAAMALALFFFTDPGAQTR